MQAAEPQNAYQPPWMRVALKELGIAELPGAQDNARIVQYHAATNGRGRFGDQTAWCSSFCNWVMAQAGVEGTRSKAARSWLKWGDELDEPQPGCVVVFWRVAKFSPFGHVALYVSETEDGRLLVLGGNQGNKVSVAPYPANRVLSYRWPSVVNLVERKPTP